MGLNENATSLLPFAPCKPPMTKKPLKSPVYVVEITQNVFLSLKASGSGTQRAAKCFKHTLVLKINVLQKTDKRIALEL